MSEIMISLQIESLEEGGYLATSEELQGFLAQGRTVAETLEIAQDVARKIIESCIEHGDQLPPQVLKQLAKPSRSAKVKIPVDEFVNLV
jgi:antitoxin HicB